MDKSIYKGLLRGAAWALIMRWTMRIIGFVNIIILARLLTPSDFGVLAMATIVIGFANSFTEMGAQQLLIREDDVTADTINTAWTIRLLQGLLVSLLILIFSGIALQYFNDQRIEPVIRLLALMPLIGGFRNIGLVLARKELNFALDFRAQVYSRFSTFIVTLVLVLWLRDYWALVYGNIIGTAISVAISYGVHPYRPRICSKKLRPYLRFASSIIPMRIAKYGNEKAAVLVVGGIATSGVLGIYNMASDLASMMTTEIAVPMARGFFPGYAKINNDHHLLASVFANVLATTATLLMPIGIGFGLVARDFVLIVLGDQWIQAIPYIQIISIGMVIGSVNHMLSSQILIVSGYERRAALLSWGRLCLYVPLVVMAGNCGGVYAIAQASTLFAFLFFPVAALLLTYSIPITMGQIVASLTRPVVSVLVMTTAVIWVNSTFGYPGLMRMLLDVIVGGTVYLGTIHVLWLISGRPDGVEKLIVNQVKRRLVSTN